MIGVSWGMIFLFLGGGALLLSLILFGFFLLLDHATRKHLDAHVAHVEKQINRVVGVADAAHAEYEAVQRQFERIDADITVVRGEVGEVKKEVERVRHRMGWE